MGGGLKRSGTVGESPLCYSWDHHDFRHAEFTSALRIQPLSRSPVALSTNRDNLELSGAGSGLSGL